MRKIKFRGLNKTNNKWEYGDLIQNYNGKKFIGNACDTYDLGIGFSEVVCDTIGQYTGVRDKKGNEIYEGDIIEAGYHRCKCKVMWDDACARFIAYTTDTPHQLVYVDMIDKNGKSAVEVIGNIYDNPELLED